MSEEYGGMIFLAVALSVVGVGVLVPYAIRNFNEYVTRRSVRTLEAMKEYRNTVRGHDPL